jgi:diguanylate cyclase (GGDEF)-like protein/putative nucleotidyltransferase with HDIG domain
MKLFDMSEYNRPAKTYWVSMVVVGAAIFAWALTRAVNLTPLQWAEFAGLLSLVILASANPIRIPSTHSSFTAGDTFTFLAVLFLGVPSAILIGCVDSFVSSRRTSRRATSWIGAPAMMAVTVFVAGNAFYFVFQSLGEISPNPLGMASVPVARLFAAIGLMAMVHYFLNGFTVATVYALRTRNPILKFWRDGYLWTWSSFLAAAIATGVAYLAVSRFGLVYVLLSLPIIAVTFWSYKVYFEKINAKTHEAEEMSRLHLSTVEALATAIDAKDQTSHCHVRRVQIYTEGMGKLLGLSTQELAALGAGALLHDIGKLAVPDHILNKPGALTAAEFEKTKIHTVVGAEILSRVNFPYPVVPIVKHHHERWDGCGYPDGLKGEQIPITARIMSVVDCFDSVREDRPFRPGMLRGQAISLLKKGAGTHFDPKIVEIFVSNLAQFELEIAERGLDADIHSSSAGGPIAPAEDEVARIRENTTFDAYDQIRNAHREVYALYEIARKFGSSLEVEKTLTVLVDKVGHLVPFDTCAVYLFDEVKGYAATALAVGLDADALRDRCIAPGEGATGFALSNRRAVNRLNPALDFDGLELGNDRKYQSMASLPLFKGDLLLGALSLYSTTLKEYSDNQIRLLETVTRLASDALANATHHAQAESNALTDPLTALPNARGLHVRFDEEVARARRNNRPFHVIMLDLDDFKLVNDSFGHKIGDRMLRDVADLIQSQLREYDFLARYAGDEFVALLPDLTAPQVEELCERIERVVSSFSLTVHAETRARVGISIGASVFGVDGETLDQLLISADQAMYRAKSAHKSGSLSAPPAVELTAEMVVEPRPELTPQDLITTAIN